MGNFGSTMFKAGFAPFFIPIIAPYIPMLMRSFPGDPEYLLIKYGTVFLLMLLTQFLVQVSRNNALKNDPEAKQELKDAVSTGRSSFYEALMVCFLGFSIFFGLNYILNLNPLYAISKLAMSNKMRIGVGILQYFFIFMLSSLVVNLFAYAPVLKKGTTAGIITGLIFFFVLLGAYIKNDEKLEGGIPGLSPLLALMPAPLRKLLGISFMFSNLDTAEGQKHALEFMTNLQIPADIQPGFLELVKKIKSMTGVDTIMAKIPKPLEKAILSALDKPNIRTALFGEISANTVKRLISNPVAKPLIKLGSEIAKLQGMLGDLKDIPNHPEKALIIFKDKILSVTPPALRPQLEQIIEAIKTGQTPQQVVSNMQSSLQNTLQSSVVGMLPQQAQQMMQQPMAQQFIPAPQQVAPVVSAVTPEKINEMVNYVRSIRGEPEKASAFLNEFYNTNPALYEAVYPVLKSENLIGGSDMAKKILKDAIAL